MELHIKNMVCRRCIMAVENLLKQLGYIIEHVQLGVVTIKETLTDQQLSAINQQLKCLGFELIDSYKGSLVSRLKALIIDWVHHQPDPIRINLSDYITSHLTYEYNYLSNLFSELESNTLENFYINQKIERAKELLTYNELTLSQIADQLGYSSVAHLSNQFKKITGFTPSHFKIIGQNKRKHIEEL